MVARWVPVGGGGCRVQVVQRHGQTLPGVRTSLALPRHPGGSDAGRCLPCPAGAERLACIQGGM